MKNLIKLVSIVSLLSISTSSFANGITVDDSKYLTYTTVSIPALPISTTIDVYNEDHGDGLSPVDFEAVQPDAAAYLAGEEMTDNLAEVIEQVNPEAFKVGNEEIAEHIALQILNI